jgi:hypothetical protein
VNQDYLHFQLFQELNEKKNKFINKSSIEIAYLLVDHVYQAHQFHQRNLALHRLKHLSCIYFPIKIINIPLSPFNP